MNRCWLLAMVIILTTASPKCDLAGVPDLAALQALIALAMRVWPRPVRQRSPEGTRLVQG
jgi:hypothetical protein